MSNTTETPKELKSANLVITGIQLAMADELEKLGVKPKVAARLSRMVVFSQIVEGLVAQLEKGEIGPKEINKFTAKGLDALLNKDWSEIFPQ